MIHYLALLSALLLSAVSGYFSILGLMALFAGAYWQIAIMGSALEISKLVTASWLYRNWDNASVGLKSYLTACVVVLIMITSLGVFGFLSKSHIEQQTNSNFTMVQEQVLIIDTNIEQEKQKLSDIEIQIVQLDTSIQTLNEAGQASKSLKAQKDLKKTRDELLQTKNSINETIADYKNKKIRLETEIKKAEAEVGPLKYIAEAIYGQENAKTHFDSAVRLVILIIVIIFDPLAVILLIAANSGLKSKQVLTQHVVSNKITKKGRKPKQKKSDDGWLSSSIGKVEIDEKDIAKF